MKKRILQSLSILGINVVVGVLGVAAFILFIFKGDPILAAVPATLALPAILLQPWFILFFFLPGGPFLAPVLTTAVSIPLYLFLDRKGKLDRAKLVLARLKNRKAVVIISSVIICVLAVGFARYIDFPPLHRGVPKTLGYSLKETDMNLSNPRYYCLGSFIDSEWLWQASLPEKDVNALADKLRMHTIACDQIAEHYLSMPPYWWHPVISEQVRVFSTTNFPMEGRGPDGWHALATWNPEDEVLHMWIKDNF